MLHVLRNGLLKTQTQNKPALHEQKPFIGCTERVKQKALLMEEKILFIKNSNDPNFHMEALLHGVQKLELGIPFGDVATLELGEKTLMSQDSSNTV